MKSKVDTLIDFFVKTNLVKVSNTFCIRVYLPEEIAVPSEGGSTYTYTYTYCEI